MGLRRQEGEFDILYWSRFEPTTGTDPKQDPANYSRVGLLGDLSDEVSNETQSTLDRASSQHESVIYGQQSSSIDITCNVLKSRDSGGSITNDPTIDGAQSQEDQTIDISTDADDEIDVSDGDVIAISGHDHFYLVRSSLNLGNGASNTVDIAPKLQSDLSGGETVSLKSDTEDPVQLVIRESATQQRGGWFLVYPEDDNGNALTGLEGEHGRVALDSFNYTRNAGEFKQFEASGTGQQQPTFFTV